MSSKLQSLADALAKADSSITIVDTVHYAGGYDEKRETRIMRGGTTVGHLTGGEGGRWRFDAPDDAKYSDVAPIIGVLDAENVKIDPGA